MFHTSSLWLITALGIQRYICVCHPLKARIWCTMKKTLRLIGIIFVMAFLNHVYRFIKFDYVAVELPSAVDANKTVVGCVRVSHVQDNETLQILENVYNFHYSVNIQFIPCVVLLVVNVLLIRTKRQAEKRRVELLRQNRRRESRMMRESTSSTLMLVIVVSLFLVLEIPIGLSQLFRSVSYPFGFTRENTSGAVVFFHLFFFLNNPCIFVVYCTMSKKFRNTLKHLLTPSCHRCTRPATEDGHNVEVIQLDIAGH
nr:hypothetical protein BaRGS_021975 [Batillaria attramentaria]